MSAILVRQHSAILVATPGGWHSYFIRYLIMHSSVSYFIYALGTIAELSFIIGFFTKKFDLFLMLILCFFILFNFFLLEINYLPWIAFGGFFWFSKFKEPKEVSKTISQK
ncbi:MAG: hypothetical protein H7X88_10620 [Gloeobacteraceae cyanobacterium ES-bin-316]|nr:hypothetical protein [Ferruginibacter sp.]